VQLLLAVLDAQPVSRVDDPDEGVGFLKVVAPVGSQGLLAAHIPFFHCQFTKHSCCVAELDERDVQILSL
jgi:hypothetical protein